VITRRVIERGIPIEYANNSSLFAISGIEAIPEIAKASEVGYPGKWRKRRRLRIEVPKQLVYSWTVALDSRTVFRGKPGGVAAPLIAERCPSRR
jgi:hypothetical protein